MNSNDPALRVEARFKNARLYNAIAAASVPLSDNPKAEGARLAGPVHAFCKLYRFNYSDVCLLLNLRAGLFNSRWRLNEPRPICVRLANVLGLDFMYLFPPELYKESWPRLVADVEPWRFLPLRAAGVLSLPSTQQEDAETAEGRTALLGALATLKPKEEDVLRRRFGLDGPEETCDAVGDALHLSRERIRQIEAKALRKLRLPSRALKLRAFLEGGAAMAKEAR